MIKLVVFDWNGVLIADAKACWEADNQVLKKFKGRPVSFKTWKKTIIIPAIDFYTMHGANKRKLIDKKEECSNIFHRFYEKRVSKVRTRKGAKQILKWLNFNKIACVILSNHTINGINLQLERLRIRNYIYYILANPSKEASLLKRNKLVKLKNFISSRKYKNYETTIIGDSPEEIEIGKSLGLKTIAITGGYYSISRLSKSKPDYLIKNLDELKKIIN